MKKQLSGSVTATVIVVLAVLLAIAPGRALAEAQPQESHNSAAVALEQVTLQLKWYHQFQFAGYYAALEQGYYEAAGLDVLIREATPQRSSAEAVLEGHADYAVSGPEVLYNYISGKPLVVLAVIFQHSPSVMLVLEDSGIESPLDLVGKRVMNYHGFSGAEFAAILINEGVAPSQVEMVGISFDINQLISGEVDSYAAYSTNEPYFLDKQGIKSRSFRPLTYGIDFYGDTLFTSQVEIRDNPKRARAFRDASLQGWEYAMAHPAEIIDLLINEYGCQKDRDLLEFEASEMRKLILPELVQLGHMNPGRWQHIADTYINLGMADECPSLDSFILDDEPLTENPYLRIAAVFAAVAAVIGLLVALMLMSFNQRLRSAVKARTAEYKSINRKLQQDIQERRGIERSLRTSEQNLSSIFDNALIGISVMDLECNYTRVNPRFASILKYDQAELLGLTYFDTLKGNEIEDARINLEKLNVCEISDISKERVFICRDGTEIVCDVTCRVILDDEGSPHEILNIVNDVSKRKHAEAALRESEKVNRAIIENSPLGISVRSRYGQLLASNSAWRKIWAMTDESVVEDKSVSRSDLSFDDSDSYLGRWLPAVRDIYTRGGTLAVPHVKTSISRPNAAKWISQYYYAILDADDEVDRVVILTEDITERMLAGEALRESEMRLAKSQEIAHIGNWEVQLATGRITWSSELYRIVGLKPGQVIPTREFMNNLVHPGNREQYDNLLDRLLENDGKLDWEFRIRHIDGTYRHVYDRASIINNADGVPERIFGIAQDITELKQAEADLRKSQEHLHQARKMEAIGVLAGGIAHDFNNILLAILGNADMLLSDLPADHQSAQFVKEIITAGKRAAGLVRQILSFSRQSDQHREWVQVAGIVTEVVKLIRSTLPSTIEIETDISALTATVEADSTELHQVILNLCANAGQAMLSNGGRLQIRLGFIDIDDDFIQLHPLLQQGRHALLTISDDGPGIEEETLGHIFEPFFTTKSVGEGTGMGLAVVHGIVTSLGGMIDVYSEIGQGTTFKVYLPAKANGRGAIMNNSPAIRGGTERILYVDDEKPIIKMAHLLLTRLGYQVTAVSDSSEALEKFLEDPTAFDLVITDQTMPNLTGAELAAAMIAVRPDIPIILCTGFSYVMDDERAKTLGIREYLNKPFTRTSLAGVIRNVLEK